MVLKRHFRLVAYPLLMLAAGTLGAQSTNDEVEAETPEPDGMTVPVSAEDLEADAQAAPPAVNEDEQLYVEFARFKQLVQDGSFDEADSVAKSVIELVINTKGPNSSEMAKALTNLAIVQHRTDQYEAAQQNYQSAIEIIEDVEDRLHAQLINPLRGLAAVQLNSGRPDLASTTYHRAVHITHVNAGPHNLDQIGLLDDLSETKLRMGDLEAAKDMQDTIYALNVRHFKADTMELVPALLQRAKWQHRVGFIFDERATYRRVIRIVEQKSGKSSLALVGPLMQLGRTYFFPDLSNQATFQQATLSTGEIYFKRALKIAAESPDSSWMDVAQAKVALGDFYMFAGNSQRARKVYQGVWDVLSDSEQDDAKLDFRRQELEGTVTLRQSQLPRFIGESDPTKPVTTDDPLFQGRITMSYTISTRGHVSELKLVEAEPHDFTGMQKSVQREIRRRLFRPRFSDAEAVEAPNQVFVHTFHYRQSDLDAARKATSATENEET